jgi:hypothetical protein
MAIINPIAATKGAFPGESSGVIVVFPGWIGSGGFASYLAICRFQARDAFADTLFLVEYFKTPGHC